MTRILETKKVRVKYPVKIGYSDKSGTEENVITDANDNTVVWGYNEYSLDSSGGINKPGIARAIVKSLNETKPIFYVTQYDIRVLE